MSTYTLNNVNYSYVVNSDVANVAVSASASGDVTILSSFVVNDVTYNVTSIGNNAFQYRTGLTSVTIPDSVTSIGDYAFIQCTGLTSITIPDSVLTIGEGAFRSCTGLTTVTIPDSVLTIGASAFQGCSGLTSVTIPNSVLTIGESAFYGCTGLTSITIPDSVTSIGINPFTNCISLTSITVSVSNSNYSSLDGVLFNKDKSILIGFPGGKIGSYTIPDSVTSIGGSAFDRCTGLTSVTIPDSVTSIGGSAFDRCTGLTSVTIGNSVTSIGAYAFYSCTGLTTITIPSSVTSIGEGAFNQCTGLTSVTIGNSVLTIGNYAFRSCTGLTSITIPDSVTSISNYAFQNCINLTVYIANNQLTGIASPASNVSFFGATVATFLPITAPTAPTLSDFTIPTKTVGDSAFQLTPPTSNSSGSFNYTSSNLAVATISGTTVTIVGAGTSTITATQAASGNYTSGTITTTFTVNAPTTTHIHQNFYLTEEFDVSANNITAAVFDAEDTTDVSGNYPNKAEIRVEKNVIQNMFQYWTDAIDMSNAVVSDIFYRVNYTDSAVPLSPDFVVGAIMTASDPNMNPDSNLTNYLPQDYLRYLAKKLFNTTRGVDLFANETEVLQSVNTRCRVGLNQILLTYLDANANGIIRDEDDFIILDPYDPVEVAGSQKVTGNPSKKIMKQILSNDPARFVDISSNYAVAGQTYWYKVPIEVGDNLYFPVTIKAPTDQQKLTQPDSTTLIEDRTYLIRCVVVADGSIPDPYNVYSYSALPSLTTFYH
jgi:hypothetical protein